MCSFLEVSDTLVDGSRNSNDKDVKENTALNVRIDSVVNSPPSTIKSTCWNPFLMDCDEKTSIADSSAPPPPVEALNKSIITPQINESVSFPQTSGINSDVAFPLNYPISTKGDSLHQTVPPVVTNSPQLHLQPLGTKEIQNSPISLGDELKCSDDLLSNLGKHQNTELPSSSVKNSSYSCYDDSGNSNLSPCIQKESVSSTTIGIINPKSGCSLSDISNEEESQPHAASSDGKEEPITQETVQELSSCDISEGPTYCAISSFSPSSTDKFDSSKKSSNCSYNISGNVSLEFSTGSTPAPYENDVTSGPDWLFSSNRGKQRGTRGISRSRTRVFRSGGRRGRPRAGGVVSRKSERKKTFRYHERFAEDSGEYKFMLTIVFCNNFSFLEFFLTSYDINELEESITEKSIR